MLSRDQFEAEIVPLREAVESRRRKYLRYYYAGIAVSCLLLATALFCPQSVLHGLQRTLQVHAQLTLSDIMAYRVFVLAGSVLLTLGPVTSYRKLPGLSLERAALSRLLAPFGVFIPAQGGGISGAELRRAGFEAAAFHLFAEEGASGEMNGVRVRLCEASLVKREEGRGAAHVFHGLMIVSDLPQAAETLWEIQQARRADPNTEFSGPDKEFAFGAEALKAYPPAETRWDERWAYTGAAFHTRVREAFISLLGKNELPAEKAYRLKYLVSPPLARARQPAPERALFMPYALEYSWQSCLVLLPGATRLFTLGSLFAPALDSAFMDRFYEVMRIADALTRHLRHA